MRLRSQGAEATYRRIIDAAHTLLDRPEGGGLSIQEVAEVAGVTRATIHNRVGSRGDLLKAVFRDQGRRIGFERVLAALEIIDPAEAVVRTTRESCRAWAVSPLAVRRTLALAALDPEVRQVVEHFEGERRSRFGVLIDRLIASGIPHGRLGREEALAVFAMTTGFPAYDAVVFDTSEEAAEGILVRLVARGLGLQ